MISSVAAGNGRLSHGLYRGLAPDATVVLLQVRDDAGHIGNNTIARVVHRLRTHGSDLGVRVVNLSLGSDPVAPRTGNPVDMAVAALVDMGVTVVAAAGNDDRRRLMPPATASDALTVGGIDDNLFDRAHVVTLSAFLPGSLAANLHPGSD